MSFRVTFSPKVYPAKSVKPNLDCPLQEQDRCNACPRRRYHRGMKENSTGLKDVSGTLPSGIVQDVSSKRHWESLARSD